MILPRYFNLTTENQERIILATEFHECRSCDGSGTCAYCHGEGYIAHTCDCEYCEIGDEDDCSECGSELGDCGQCNGAGVRLLTEGELMRAGFTKSEASDICQKRQLAEHGKSTEEEEVYEHKNIRFATM